MKFRSAAGLHLQRDELPENTAGLRTGSSLLGAGQKHPLGFGKYRTAAGQAQVGSWCPGSCHGGSWCQWLPSPLCQARGTHSWPPRSSGCYSYLLKLTWASLPANTAQLRVQCGLGPSAQALPRLQSWGGCVGLSNAALQGPVPILLVLLAAGVWAVVGCTAGLHLARPGKDRLAWD